MLIDRWPTAVPNVSTSGNLGPASSVGSDLLDCTPTGLVALDESGRLLLANTAARQMLGLSDDGTSDDATHEPIGARLPPEFAPAHLFPSDRARLLPGIARDEQPLRLVTRQGFALAVTRRDGPSGRLLAFTPVEPAEIATTTQIDGLTGLIGRQLFDEALAALCAAGREIAVLMVDLDRFKTINDSLGHAAGDALLRIVAARLRATLRAADVIGRFGGDQFVIILSAGPEIVTIAERIATILARPYLIDKQVATIGASVGVAVAPVHGTSAAELLRAADLALVQAKSDGRGRVRLFDSQLDQQTRFRHALADDLRRAIPLGQLLLHFQPQICLATGALSGFEALVRWNHPQRGMIGPDQFIPLAEDLNLINALGEWVMREACRLAMTWPTDVAVAVNVSPKQLLDGPRLLTLIKSVLAQTGLPPARLEVEITETALVREAESLQLLRDIRALGVMISMDDFGTGYSSLSQLRRFPFDKLKIDRSFVRELGSSDEAAGVVRAISALGQSLGMTTIAEGVETADQEAICRADGCTVMQGYLVSRPVPADEVVELVLRLAREGKLSPMSEDLFRIVYCSRKAAHENDISLNQILATSRRNNGACGVTGALLYSGGLFVQTLEGPFDAVQSVFERIQVDLRHDDVIVIETETVTERLFGKWSMAAAEPDDPAATHALVERVLLMPASKASETLIALLSQVLTYAPA